MNLKKTKQDFDSPYGDGYTSERILKVLLNWKFQRFYQKEFYDGLEKNLRH